MKIRPAFAGAMVIAVNALDYVTFTLAVGVLHLPIQLEQNPLMVATWTAGGALLVLALKAAFVALILWAMSRVTTRSLWPPFLLGYGVGLLGATANVLAVHAFAEYLAR